MQDLNLGDCLLKSRGAYFLADVLDVQHKMLENVDLSFNEIRANAGVELANALQSKEHLKNLNLDGNLFGTDGCGQIKDIMDASINPNALAEFEEDESEDEGEENDDDDDDDGDDDERGESAGDETVSEEEAESYEGEEYEEDYAEDIENENYIAETSGSESDVQAKERNSFVKEKVKD